jgi:hypothetical protein
MDLSKPLEEYMAQSKLARALDKALEESYDQNILAKETVLVCEDKVRICMIKCKSSRTSKESVDELEKLESEAHQARGVSEKAYRDLQQKQAVFFAFVESVENALTRMLHGTNLKRAEILALSGEKPLSTEEAAYLDSWNLGDKAFAKAFEDLLKADEYRLYGKIVEEATYLHDRWWYWTDHLKNEESTSASSSDDERPVVIRNSKRTRKTCNQCGCPYCDEPGGAGCIFMRNIADDVKYISIEDIPPPWRSSPAGD